MSRYKLKNGTCGKWTLKWTLAFPVDIENWEDRNNVYNNVYNNANGALRVYN